MSRFESGESGTAILETPPPQKPETKKVKKASRQKRGDVSYLKEATKEDHAQSLRTIEVQEIPKTVTSIEEFGKRIDEKEYERRRYGTQFYVEDASSKEHGIVTHEEIAIIEELPSPQYYEEFRFYIARRMEREEVFKPETVLLAQHKEIPLVYLAPYTAKEAKRFDALDETRFLGAEERAVLYDVRKETKMGQDDNRITVSGHTIGKGGEGTIRLALRRLKEKFFPVRGAAKGERVQNFSELTPEAELVIPLQRFLSYGGSGSDNILHPLTTMRPLFERKAREVLWELADISEENHERFLILNLAEAIERNLLDEKQKLTALLHLFRGLDFLEKHGITHNDIKPANLFLTEQQLKIGDFGLMLFNKEWITDRNIQSHADDLHSVYAFQRRHGIVGTPQFMHPRRCLGGIPPEKLHPRYDIFSASMTAIKLLLGSLPSLRDPSRKYTHPEEFAYHYQELRTKIDAAFDKYEKEHPEKSTLIALLKRGIIEEESMVNPRPVEELLPSAQEFIRALEAMGVKESLNLRLSKEKTSELTEIARAAHKGEQTKSVHL